MKAGDRAPPFQLYLSELVNNVSTPIDLSGMSAQFVMVNSLTKVVKVDQPADIVNAAQGFIQYQWLDGDTDTQGDYLILVKITDTVTGFIRTFPSEGYIYLTIEKNYS